MGRATGFEDKTQGTLFFDVCRILKEKRPKAFMLENEPKLPSRSRNIRGLSHGPTSWISITICEGKNRQIRKMTAAVGFATLRLVRIRIGDIHIDNMIAGEVVTLTNFDDALNQ